jgi:Putative MetA-pathway of phenol degradation
MNKPLLCACLVLALLSPQARAQFTDPRTYNISPVGINQLELGYAHVHANASIDTSLIITGAKVDLNQGIIDYTRYFGLLHRLTWVEAGVPIAGLSGSVVGTNIQGSIVGAGDSSYAVGILLKGGPALNLAEFEKFNPTTTVGASLTITAPTGSYNANKILNLGSDRWSFKPEVALSHPFGPEQKWEVEAYGNLYFYTDNTSYHGREVLKQQPLPGFEGHVSYSFNDRLWTSLDARYSFHGSTWVNGVDQNNPQSNFILGSEMNISLNARNSLVLEFGKALVHRNGPSIAGFSVKYDYTWGSAYK